MKAKNRADKQGRGRRGRLIFAAFLLLLISCSSVEKELENLNSSDTETRREAVISLAHRLKESNTGESPQHGRIVAALASTATGDPNPYVRAAALSLLVENAPVDSPETISACLKDSSPLVRQEAVKAAGKLKAEFLIAAIVKLLLEDQDVSVRRACPAVLASFLLYSGAPLSEEATREILEALCNALQDEEDSVRFAVRESLVRLLGTDAGDNMEEWKRLLEKSEKGG